MSASRFTRFAPIVCVAIAAWASPQEARAQDCIENDTVRITLTNTGTGKGEISAGCWMPSVAVPSKVLCAHDIKKNHTFTFALENQCDIDVRLELVVTRGDIKMQRPGPSGPPDNECDDGASRFLFADYLPATSGQITRNCVTKTHWKWPIKWTREGSYALVATRVRKNGVETTLAQPVIFDPEIILEDNGKLDTVFLGALVLLAAGAVYAIYRMLRRA